MSFRFFALAPLALLLVVPRAAAFTPESGLWWNPAESGRGYAIEIQDNVLQILVYAYDNDRTSAFFVGAGPMQSNSQWSAPLDGSTSGQCLTCNYEGRPIILNGAGGTASIVFDTEAKARMTIGSRVIPIERFNFALGNVNERMLGEWQIIFDLSTRPGGSPTFQSFPYFGDVLKFDRVDTGPNPDQFRGCRPENSLVPRCSASANANHDVAGFYDATEDEYVIVVTDVAGSSTTTQYLVYYVTAGLSQFDGLLQFRVGSNAENPPAFYPVRGFRSASRRFVQTGFGPSAVEPSTKSGVSESISGGLLERIGGIDAVRGGFNAAEAKAISGIDPTVHEAQVQALIRSLQR